MLDNVILLAVFTRTSFVVSVFFLDCLINCVNIDRASSSTYACKFVSACLKDFLVGRDLEPGMEMDGFHFNLYSYLDFERE